MDGVILYPKPPGPTSHDVVARVRARLRAEHGPRAGGARRGPKVGHAGTLDPFATGLLLVLVGRATRAQRFLLGLPKTYRAVARLGWTSDTGDPDGRLTETGRRPAQPELPVGALWQRPPAYSAVRVEGVRLHERARRGEAVEGAPRRVVVHRAETLWHDAERACFELEVSSGTYVRQLVAGLGDAYCERLERTAIGPFRLADADEARIVPLADALSFMPERALGPAEAEGVAHGRPVEGGGGPEGADDGGGASGAARSAGAPGEGADQDRAVRLTHEGRLVAIAEPREGLLRPTVVLVP